MSHVCGPTCNLDPIRQRRRLDKATERQGECLVWLGQVLANGYGSMRVHYRRRYVHRLAYELAYGPIPPGMQIDHRCRNRRCVEPSHLEVVTNAENVRRGIPYRRQSTYVKPDRCGKGHPMDEANTYKAKRGWKCRTCMRAWQQARYVPRDRKPETHCRKRGHEFTPENTIIQSNGARTCRACRRASKGAPRTL